MGNDISNESSGPSNAATPEAPTNNGDGANVVWLTSLPIVTWFDDLLPASFTYAKSDAGLAVKDTAEAPVNMSEKKSATNSTGQKDSKLDRKVLPNGARYEGKLVNGIANGRGSCTWDSGKFKGDLFKGEWKDDMMNGCGSYRFSDGATYEGEYKDGNFHGPGKFTFPQGDVYEGEYKEGKRHGRGTFRWVDGTVYVGDWVDNKLDGRGTKRWPDGDVFEGEFKENKYNGHGVFRASHGAVYEGDWKDDKRHGQGNYKKTDGTVLVGVWKNDKLNRKCVIC